MPPPRRDFCKRGHRIGDNPYVFPDGARACRQCRAIWKRARNDRIKAQHAVERQQRLDARPPLSPVPYGVSSRVLAARRTWAVRRTRYGPSGTSPEKLPALIARSKLLIRYALAHPKPTRTNCRRGHQLTTANTRVSRFQDQRNGRWYQRRVCRTCERMRAGQRPAWVDHAGVRVSVLVHDRWYLTHWRALTGAMLAAHPDKGGTSRAFITARQVRERFLQEQGQWYRALGLSVPRRRKGPRDNTERLSA